MHVTVYSFSVISTATNMQNCVTATTSNLSNAYADLKNMSGVAAGLSQDVLTAQKTLESLKPRTHNSEHHYLGQDNLFIYHKR